MTARGRTLTALASAALAFPAVATAGAHPVSPESGGATTSHPTFVWTLPAGETSEGIEIASKPAVTPAGKFFTENVVDSAVFQHDETTWAPDRPLFAGPYWWSVQTRDKKFDSLYSAPHSFVVAAAGRIGSVTLKRYPILDSLDATVKWTTNVQAPVVTFRVKRAAGGKLLWSDVEHEDTLVANSPGQDTETWQRGSKVKLGARLVLTVTLKAGAVTRTVSRPFRAP